MTFMESSHQIIWRKTSYRALWVPSHIISMVSTVYGGLWWVETSCYVQNGYSSDPNVKVADLEAQNAWLHNVFGACRSATLDAMV